MFVFCFYLFPLLYQLNEDILMIFQIFKMSVLFQIFSWGGGGV